jgi:hypothetical protein
MSDTEFENQILALGKSLEFYAAQNDSPTPEYLAGFSADSIRPFRAMGDSAKYWIGKSDEILTFTFPAILYMGGRSVKSAPYFNLNTASPVSPFICDIYQLILNNN